MGLDRARYPHRFDAVLDSDCKLVQSSGYLGTVCTNPIKHREVIREVPWSLCITVDQIKYGWKRPHCGPPDASFKLTELGSLIESEPLLFSKEEQEDAEILALTLFLMVEIAKGKGSRWFPFLQILNEVDEQTD